MIKGLMMPRKKTIDEFIIESNIVHDNKYHYDNTVYINNHSPVIVSCPTHGKFNVLPKRHTAWAQGCPICGIGALNYKTHTIKSRNTQESFLSSAKAIHGDRYDYSLCVYSGGKVKMPIICKIHGIFEQHAESHINAKNGCVQCYNHSRIGRRAVSGYCHTFFESYPETKIKPAVLYVAHMQHKNDSFIKIGITVKDSIKARYYSKSKSGTIITPLIEHKDSLYDAYIGEQHILSALSEFRYYPNRKFGGYTECLKINKNVIDFLENYFGINIPICLNDLIVSHSVQSAPYV